MAEKIQVKFLVFSFLCPQKRTSGHGHARKRAKVGALLPPQFPLGCSELSPDPSLGMLLLSLSSPWKQMMVQDRDFHVLEHQGSFLTG